jgi:hypothetical protein
MSNIVFESSEKVPFIWGGKVQNPSDTGIYNFNLLTISFRKLSLFRELNVFA